MNKIQKELEEQKKKHPDFKKHDEVLKQITKLFDNKVGKQFSKDELNKIYQEGKERYEQQIPPGYKDLSDKNKKGDQYVYGDLIIWKEMLNYSKKEKKEIVFITDDRKEDWWRIENGKTIRPREELIKEFYDFTGNRILIYNADSFLHFAKERKLVTTLKATTIQEVKNVRLSDENYITTLNFIKGIDIEDNIDNSGKIIFKPESISLKNLFPSLQNITDNGEIIFNQNELTRMLEQHNERQRELQKNAFIKLKALQNEGQIIGSLSNINLHNTPNNAMTLENNTSPVKATTSPKRVVNSTKKSKVKK